ncbi:MAG: hypothetical protein COU40_02020 [Candidatus Moranbacteria bacterium CG10_big_fil_rev_8_21_14_0_10_35_21]|nr:MAG: hypothetical protein COU40_02020 [Candidatus Moranbacteria bacterium CG10_big_fil_rev_8_21_14_0_10_35_21]PJA88606.1 MAG: hypothetical protein CO139_02340 [Candidatus Moranbacteria bacterium CG_4_9_14_3_um_filter_36_9]
MFERLKNINKIKLGLLNTNILLVFFLILLSNLGVLPFQKMGDFLFFVFLILVFALYRPGWAFLFFIGTIALENINLAPREIGIMIRPYQFFGTLSILAIAIRFLAKRLNFPLIKLKWPDYLIILLAISSFMSAFASPDKMASLKLAVIFLSFVFLYFLSRTFIQNADDLKRIVPFFLSSSLIIIFYGIWQNIQFIFGGNAFETMPGRPNATFFEADWLGMYLVLLLATLYSFIYYFNKKLSAISGIINEIINYKLQKIILYTIYLVLTASYILLILTVSRSAWLGAATVTLIFLIIILTNLKSNNWKWKLFTKVLRNLAIAGICSIGIVYFFNLTSFQLFNRAQSTGTGLQKITIACEKRVVLPETIADIEELKKHDCKHINLEDIESNKSAGKIIMEVYRPDPNVNIRQEIYQKSLAEIKDHPIFGVGWGSIGKVLGTDERGTDLNSSNIFLEIYLGSGVVGFLAFIIVWIYILVSSIRNFYSAKNELYKTVAAFILLGLIGLTTANLFNAGILLGFIWVFLALGLINKKPS